jgi:transcriptional regulator with XRE-family HTH domain
MNEPWTANVVGRLHRYGISQTELARKCDYAPQYLSQILNGKKEFSSEESIARVKRIIFDSLSELEQEVRDERGLSD